MWELLVNSGMTNGVCLSNVRTLALVDKVIKNVGRTGLPWGILGDFNYGAKDMQGTLAEWQIKMQRL